MALRAIEVSRRSLLGSAAAAIVSASLPLSARAAAQPSGRSGGILLHSNWQNISIADLAQTAGALALLERHAPSVPVTLWPLYLEDPFELALRRRFNGLRIVRGEVDPQSFRPKNDEVQDALNGCDAVVHNSAPFVVSPLPMEAAREAKKPYAFFGVTLADLDEKQTVLLSNASLVLAAETSSAAAAKRAGINAPLGTCPDAAFAFDLRNDSAADAFCREHKLEREKFLVCVPRLRYTPFKKRFAPNEIDERSKTSEQFAEVDHAKFREAIVAWVRTTKQKVLVAPQMPYQIEIMDRLVIEPLPADVRPHVVKRSTFWLPDEASSVFARSAAVLSFELHAAILALAAGRPAMHVRLPTVNYAAQILRDVGLGEWIVEIGETTGEQLGKKILSIQADPKGTQSRLQKATVAIRSQHKTAVSTVLDAHRMPKN